MNNRWLKDFWQLACKKQRESEGIPDMEYPFKTKAEAVVAFIEAHDLRSVKKMTTPLTEDDASWLLSKYSFPVVCDVLLSMENYKGLNRKYKSCKLTANNWCKKRAGNRAEKTQQAAYDVFD